ncbi:MAG: murein biosynthesis integral membrane protein MurJ [Deltaproteobacteria bacterium]|nr:murein biosynthesis integral membrane protein MurJ [Deltaproteobacteria bacterium]
MSKPHSITRAALVVSSSTFVSRILGFIRDILIFRYFDKTTTDAFIVAFRIPNLMRRLFGEGALSVSFIPIFTDYLRNKTKEEARELVAVSFTYLSIAVCLCTLLAHLFAREIIQFLAMGPGFSQIPQKYMLSAELLKVMFPYLIFISLVSLAMGILNSLKHFFVPAIAPVFLNLSIIAGILFFRSFFEAPIFSVAWGVFLGGVAQILLQVPWLVKHGYFPKISLNWNHPGFQKVMRLMLPAVIGLSSIQFSILIVQEFASFLKYEGAISFLFLADRMIQFPLGVFAIAFGTALLPSLADHVATQNHTKFKEHFLLGIRSVSFISMPAMVGLIVLDVPLIRILFERGHFTGESTLATAEALSFYAFGLWSASLQRVVVPAYYAFHNTLAPAVFSFVSLFLNVVFCFLLIVPLQHGGLALATSLSSILQIFILMVYFKKKYISFSWKEFLVPQLKYIFCALVMGAFLYGLRIDFSWEATEAKMISTFILICFIFLGFCLYVGMAYLFKLPEVEIVINTVKMRFRKGARS